MLLGPLIGAHSQRECRGHCHTPKQGRREEKKERIGLGMKRGPNCRPRWKSFLRFLVNPLPPLFGWHRRKRRFSHDRMFWLTFCAHCSILVGPYPLRDDTYPAPQTQTFPQPQVVHLPPAQSTARCPGTEWGAAKPLSSCRR